MRWIHGTVTFADTTSKNQLAAAIDQKSRTIAFTAKARSTNTGKVYLGNDSGVATTDGVEVLAGDREDWDFGDGSVKTSAFYSLATDSGDVLDWAMVVEP